MKHKNMLVVPVETFLKSPEDFLKDNYIDKEVIAIGGKTIRGHV